MGLGGVWARGARRYGALASVAGVVGLAALVALVGCQPSSGLELPRAPDDTATAILVVSAPGEGGALVAELAQIIEWRARDVAVPLTLPPAAELAVLYYSESAEDLDLPTGIVRPASPLEASQPLPAAAARFARGLDDDAWRPLGADEVPPILIPASGASACARSRGCLVDGVCRLSCPEPSVPGPPRAVVARAPLADDCPAGWQPRFSENLGGQSCAPVALARNCAPGTAAFLDGPSCARLGRACPAGDYPPAPSGDVLYVKHGALSGGNGTALAPFSSISAAVAVAPPGSTILVSSGTFVDDVSVLSGRSVRLEGACVGGTILSGSFSVEVGARATVSTFTIAARRAQDLVVVSSGGLELEHVEVVGGRLGVEVLAGTSTVTRSVVRDQRFDATGSASIGVYDQARLVARDVVSERSAGFGVHAVIGALDLTRVVVVDSGGPAFSVVRGATIDGAELVADGATAAAFSLADGARGTLSRIAARGTAFAEDSAALRVRGSELTVSHALVDGSAGHVRVDADGVITMRDALLVDAVTGLAGAAIVLDHARATFERVELDGYDGRGLVATESDVVGADLAIWGCAATGSCEDAIDGVGGSLALSRLEVRGVGSHAVFVYDTEASLVDVVLADLRPTVSEYGSSAVRAGGLSELVVQGLSVDRSPMVGVDFQGNSVGRMSHVHLRGTRGGGLELIRDASVAVSVLKLEGLEGPGIIVGGGFVAGTPRLDVIDLEIDGVEPGDLGIVAGVLTRGPVVVDVERFLIAGVMGPAIRVDRPTVNLKNGRITTSLIGLDVPDRTFDVAPLLDGVKIDDSVTVPFGR